MAAVVGRARRALGAIKAFGKLLILLLSVLAILAWLYSWLKEAPFAETLISAWGFGGIATLFIAWIMASGFIGTSYVKSDLMFLSPGYMETMMRQDPEERSHEYGLLVFGSLLGLSILGMAGLLIVQPDSVPFVAGAIAALTAIAFVLDRTNLPWAK